MIQDLKNNAKFQEKMKFTREQFYPALNRATTSIDDALQNLSIINSLLMEKFLGFMKEKTVKDLNLIENLSSTDPKYSEMREMLELFDNMSVFDAKDLMEGLKNEINLFLQEENKGRKLEVLKTKWIDEL